MFRFYTRKPKEHNFMVLLILIVFSSFPFSQVYNKNKTESKWLYYKDINSPLPSNIINTIKHDQYGNTYIGCGKAGSGGLLIFNNNDWKLYGSQELGNYNRGITAILIEKDTKSLYLGLNSNGGFGGGVLKQTSNGFERIFTNYIYEGYQSDVRFLYQLNNGNIWIGYEQYMGGRNNYCNGIDEISGEQISNITDEIDLPSGSYTSCIQFNDEIWVTTRTLIKRDYYYGGVGRLKNGLWTTYTNENSNIDSENFWEISVDKKEHIWIGSNNGLRIFDGDNWSIIDQSNSEIPFLFVKEINFDRLDNLWFSSHLMKDGIIKYDKTSFNQYFPTDSTYMSGAINDLSVDNNNNVWIATNDGVIVFNENGIDIVDTVLEDEIINKYKLLNNYPNPFNPSTTISYSLPQSGLVQLIIYDLLGREVEKLVNKEQEIGNYKIVFNSSKLKSGVYFYRLQSGNFTETKKLILLR